MSGMGDVGFIGTGTLTAAVVRGIRSREIARTIRLSPRSEELSQALCSELENVVRDSSNADVVANSDIVILSVRPQQLDDALKDLTFRPDQIVVSFVATVATADVARLVAPAERVCRVTPLPSIASAKGPIIISPAITEVVDLFQGLGDLILARTEDEIMKLGCASGLMSTFFELEHSVAAWLVKRGVPSDHASLYVRSLFSSLADTALRQAGIQLLTLADQHQTLGGLNEHARQHLNAAGLFDRLQSALDSVSAQSLRSVAFGSPRLRSWENADIGLHARALTCLEISYDR